MAITPKQANAMFSDNLRGSTDRLMCDRAVCERIPDPTQEQKDRFYRIWRDNANSLTGDARISHSFAVFFAP